MEQIEAEGDSPAIRLFLGAGERQMNPFNFLEWHGWEPGGDSSNFKSFS
jgi:hypothetical protein